MRPNKWVGHAARGFALAAIVGSAVPGGASAQSGAASPPAIGQSARDFTLHRLDGAPITLSGLRKSGPVVVLVLRGWVGYQ